MMNPLDKLVEAIVLDNDKEPYKLRFRISSIEYLREVSEEVSAIVLNSQVVIPVALKYEELNELIYESDFKKGSKIDLKELTGLSSADIKPLSKKIAEEEANKDLGIKIQAVLRKCESNKLVNFDFFEKDIATMEPVDTCRSKCGVTLKITFNSEAKKPFEGEHTASIDMPYDDFQYYLSEIKRKGYSTLDLQQTFANNKNRYGVKL